MNYNKYYNSLLKNKEFVSLKTNRQRIEFILKFVRPLRLFQKDVQHRADIYRSQHCKSAEKCCNFREQGIKYYNTNSYQDAIIMFEKAILSAPFPSKENTGKDLSLSFAHKSLAEFHLKQYESSLFSADFSLKFFETIEMHIQRVHCLRLMRRYTEAVRHLDELVQKCNTNGWSDSDQHSVEHLMAIKRYMSQNCFDTDESFTAIPQQVMTSSDILAKNLEDSEVNVWLHPNIQIKETERKGRHFVATNFIPKDTVILLEKPISIVLYTESKSKVCGNCFKSTPISFWPCSGCDEVLYCNKQCFSTAYEAYHKHECGISGLLESFDDSFSHTFNLISRAGIQKAFECEEQNIGFDFERYLKSKTQQIGNISDNHSEEDKDFETEFKAFYSLVNHCSVENSHSDVYFCFKAIETALLLDYSKQFDFIVEENYKKFVTLTEICLKNTRKVQINVFGCWILFNEMRERTYVGSRITSLAALTNHSCQPNVAWNHVGAKMVFVANQDINGGQEVCITYGPTIETMPFIERQMALKTDYFFDCNCEACLRDCKTILCIRCLHCSGPVVPTELGAFAKREDRCLECGQKFENLRQTVVKINAMKNRFEEMIHRLDYNYEIESSLNVALNTLGGLMQLAYRQSQPLRHYLKQLIRAYVRHKRFDEAVGCIDHFGAAIDLKYDSIEDMDSISAEILDDLLLLTNCYYIYLIESQVSDTKHWNNSFQLYSKLIASLKKGRNYCKESAEQNKEVERLNHKISSTIKDKKNELVQLQQYYHFIEKQI